MIPITFTNKINVVDSGCWEWTRDFNTQGYGRYTTVHASPTKRQKRVFSHRYAYAYVYGEIPDGLVIDHLCKNPKCCNPLHLEAVTQSVNLLRSTRANTHENCPKCGGPWSYESTSTGHKMKRCGPCRRASMTPEQKQRRYERRQANRAIENEQARNRRAMRRQNASE